MSYEFIKSSQLKNSLSQQTKEALGILKKRVVAADSAGNNSCLFGFYGYSREVAEEVAATLIRHGFHVESNGRDIQVWW